MVAHAAEPRPGSLPPKRSAPEGRHHDLISGVEAYGMATQAPPEARKGVASPVIAFAALSRQVHNPSRVTPAEPHPLYPVQGAAVFIAAASVSVILAVVLALSATMKLQRNPQVVESVHGVVGFPLDRFWVLASLELAAAAGLVIGLFLAPLGIAAAIGSVAYFVGAIIAHVRVGDTKGVVNPTVPLALSIAALVLRALSA